MIGSFEAKFVIQAKQRGIVHARLVYFPNEGKGDENN